MDDIITLIIVLITVVSAISRIRSKQKTKSAAAPGKGGELGARLKAFFAEIQRQLEAQTPKSASGDATWDQLQDEGTQPQDYEFDLEELEPEEEEPPAPPVGKPPVPPAGNYPQPAATQAVDPAPAPCAPEPMAYRGAACPDFLRRAIVWSEILGPPKALRDTSWER